MLGARIRRQSAPVLPHQVGGEVVLAVAWQPAVIGDELDHRVVIGLVGSSVEGDLLRPAELVPAHGAEDDDADPESEPQDRKSTRLNSSHLGISYAVFC